LISLKNINFKIHNKTILKDICFNIEKNSITQIFGPNGAGKTTLFKIIAGVITDYTGSILINNKKLTDIPVKKLAKELTFLPQFHHFSLPVSVKDILIAGRYPYSSLFSSYSKTDMDILYNAVEEFELQDIIDRDATTLSGGEIKKVMLASAFIQNVPLILLDEPFVSLDPLSAVKLKNLLVKLNNNGKTIVVISHRMELMYPVASDIVAINEGKIIYSGKKDGNLNILKKTLGTNFKRQIINNKEYLYFDE